MRAGSSRRWDESSCAMTSIFSFGLRSLPCEMPASTAPQRQPMSLPMLYYAAPKEVGREFASFSPEGIRNPNGSWFVAGVQSVGGLAGGSEGGE